MLIERHKMPSYVSADACPCAMEVEFSMPLERTALTRTFARTPFVPGFGRPDRRARRGDPAHPELRAEEARRAHAREGDRRRHLRRAGQLSGAPGHGANDGSARAQPARDIVAVSMPCFGTTKRTRSNAEKLCGQMGVTFKEVDITAAVRQHFQDIGHDEAVRDVTYENGQARERTQVLMNIANQMGGFVVGTGDLSELALGWATYNGDHMSMYGVNAGVPKTLVRYIVRYEAGRSAPELAQVLYDILDTPVSARAAARRRTGRDSAEDGGSRRPLRAARFLSLLHAALRLLAEEDLSPRAPCVWRKLRRPDRAQVAAHVLPPLLRPAVQALLPARRPEGRLRDAFAARRLADALGCLCGAVAGGDRRNRSLTVESVNLKSAAARRTTALIPRSERCRCGGVPARLRDGCLRIP